VNIVGSVTEAGGTIVSSSAIRDELAEGNVGAANARLGYRWFVTGIVTQGDRRGRELGFPTANIRLGADCRLRHGIYAVRIQRPGGAMLEGVASYGRRPTFDNGAPLLEVFLFDFSGDLYGEELAVSFVQWLRPELKFDGLDPLIAAMKKDVADANLALRSEPEESPLDKALAALP
jgi:riboflavin kinase/FMN adenylyltransferase